MKTEQTTGTRFDFGVIRSRFPGRDDGTSRVAEYESLLDLFTLISFILIFAAFLYVGRFQQGGQPQSDVAAQIAKSDSGAATSLPQDLLLVLLFKQNGSDMLTVKMNGHEYTPLHGEPIASENATEKLDKYVKPVMQTAAKVELAFQDPKNGPNPLTGENIQLWFAAKKCNYTQLFFAR